jgi:hypothetical protein
LNAGSNVMAANTVFDRGHQCRTGAPSHRKSVSQDFLARAKKPSAADWS